MMETIIFKKKLYAIIIKSKFHKKGINFLTKPNHSLQLGYINYKKNHEIKSHYHPKSKRIINNTNEVLIIKKGKIRIDFFENENKKKYIKSKILDKGDIILIIKGGHGFKIIKEVSMIEVKQGPYQSKDDKIRIYSKIKKIKIAK
jgi:hypothetical protein